MIRKRMADIKVVHQSVIKKTCSRSIEMTFIYRYPTGNFETISKRIARGSFANATYPHDFPRRSTPKCKKEMDIPTEMKELRTMFPRSRQVQTQKIDLRPK
ncbi:PREDICTED: uncharacterized protein LOC105153689 isoform X2 [Acromyrmex echinatior]|uniref:uncharacterized protein LOC105153689 isoform X2 n=1 Tax=Acromyrmex echinatior TaxID=103372 RepID=UPI000580CEA3|nr:PREDICTED: uncharacterized protein LOC105153689 isoform X2 [Acromyrmex echinatior]